MILSRRNDIEPPIHCWWIPDDASDYFWQSKLPVLKSVEVQGDDRSRIRDDRERRQNEPNPLLPELLKSLKDDQLVLPSLPNIAQKINNLIRGNPDDIEKLIAALSLEPVICVKIMRVVNSPLYRGHEAIKSIKEAVVRLGVKMTQQLVLSFALNDIFVSKVPLIESYMQYTWRQSVDVAAISYILATKVDSLNADQAMLLGLLHNIGNVPLLMMMENKPDSYLQRDVIEGVLSAEAASVGGVILREWNFDEVFAQVCEQSQIDLSLDALNVDIAHVDDREVDYCDLVVLAKAYKYLSLAQTTAAGDLDGKTSEDLLSNFPAFKRYKNDSRVQQSCVQILDAAHQEIQELSQLFV